MQRRPSAQIRADSSASLPPHEHASTASSWLSLGQAATAIGVHPITLRRWAEGGKIAVSRTAGGHRRFLAADVDAFLRDHRRIRRFGGLEGRWAAHAQGSIRRGRLFGSGPVLPLEPRDRARFRRSGQRLLSLMAGVSGGNLEPGRARRRARRLGRAYSAWAARKHVTSADMLRAFAVVRQALIDAAIDLAQEENLEPQAVRGLVSVMEELTQAVEIGLFEDTQAAPAPTAGTD